MDLESFKNQFDVDLQRQCRSVIEMMCNAHYLKISDQRCRLTLQGQLLLDSIAARLIETADHKHQPVERP
jgi:coproporphyrinogen III oxidase-like Fe-S oxidoreductase